MLPEHEVIIREHARLHVEVMRLPALCGLNDECFIRRSQVIDLLELKAKPPRPE